MVSVLFMEFSIIFTVCLIASNIPFATSGGSSIKKACEDLKVAYPDVNWKEG